MIPSAFQRVHEFNDVHCNDMGMARQRVEFGAQKLEGNRTDDGTTVPSSIKPVRQVTATISNAVDEGRELCGFRPLAGRLAQCLSQR